MTGPVSEGMSPAYGSIATGREPANLGDILERVLDKGIIIAGDIRVSLLDIELLTVKLRLLVASVDTARQLGIDWWERDPWLTSKPAAQLNTSAPGAEPLPDSPREHRRRQAIENANETTEIEERIRDHG